MGKDTVKLYSDINRYLDKPIVEKKKTEETLPPLFENKQDINVNPEEVAIQESQEKIAELEQKLAELKDKYENGNKNKAFTGGTAGLPPVDWLAKDCTASLTVRIRRCAFTSSSFTPFQRSTFAIYCLRSLPRTEKSIHVSGRYLYKDWFLPRFIWFLELI